MQYRQPMQRGEIWLTMAPSSPFSVAMTGQTGTQEGFPHCMQGSGR